MSCYCWDFATVFVSFFPFNPEGDTFFARVFVFNYLREYRPGFVVKSLLAVNPVGSTVAILLSCT